MSSKPIQTPTSWARAIVDTLEGLGIDTVAILKRTGLNSDCLADRDSMIEQDVVTELWEAAVAATGNENIGYQVGQQIHKVLNPIVAHSLMSCASLKASCDRLCRYQDIVAEGLVFDLRETDSAYFMVLDILADKRAPSSQAIKSAMAACISFMRWITRQETRPLSVSLKEPRPSDISTHEKLFACPVDFEQDENRMVFNKQVLLAPLPTADTRLSSLHEQALQSFHKQHFGVTLTDEVRAHISAQLPSGEPSQELTASRLNMSVSTLKRRLKEAGKTYNVLLDETRYQLALDYLSQSEVSISEITYLLGFSQSSAFTRAFKRWHGVSPTRYRAGRF